MNIFEALQPQIEAFKITRDHIVDTASLPPIQEGMSCGEPPFAMDDGTHYYAVINADEEVSPLPFGYQVADEDLEHEGVEYLLSVPKSTPGCGLGFARYVPLAKDFEVPSNRAFCLETAEDSKVWESIGTAADAFQQIVNDKALFNFNQRLTRTISYMYESIEELESVDEAISVLFLETSVLPLLFLRSYQDALEAIEEELNDQDDDSDDDE